MEFSCFALAFCAMRCNLLQCGSDTAALLGRFLPRLGPLASASGPFFCLHAGRRASGSEFQFGGAAACTERSLPPCAGGLGRWVVLKASHLPPPLTPPHKGEGNTLCQIARALLRGGAVGA
jgi:hypothetical protein